MRIVSMSHLKGQEILGKPIYDGIGRILLSEGTPLTPFYIEKLKSIGITFVYVDDAISKDVLIEDTLSEKTRQMSKMAVKEMVDRYNRDGKINSDGIAKSANTIIEDILSNKEVIVNVSEIRSKGDDLYSHSINVCALSVVLGIHFGFNMLKLKDLAIGAMLHDLGKTPTLINKKLSGKALPPEEMEKLVESMHPRLGYDFMGSQGTFSATSKIAVLMHHERMDGSGFPLGLKGSEINDVAKLVAICDTFDNLVTGSKNRPAMPVYAVLEYLVGMSGYHFDAELVKNFTMHVAAYPSGSAVKLNSQEKCLVVRQNSSFPTRPVVKVIYDREGNKLQEPFEIDLTRELTLFITEVCDL